MVYKPKFHYDSSGGSTGMNKAGTGNSVNIRISNGQRFRVSSGTSGRPTIIYSEDIEDEIIEDEIIEEILAIWKLTKTLPAPEGLREVDEFGVSVAIDGEYAIVGAHNFDLSGDVNTGGAFIYKRDGDVWTGPITLPAPEDLELNDGFGRYVAIDGEYAIVGATNFDLSGGVNTGGAFIYKRDGDVWTGPITLQAPKDLELNDHFGLSVAIDGEYVIVGGYRIDLSGGVNTGAAFIYKRDGDVWTGPITLQAPKDLEENDDFGISVAINGEYAIVGADQFDLSGGVNTGAAFIYKRDGDVWTGPITLQAPKDLEENDNFGWSVAIDGEYAIVGANLFDLSGGVNTGGAFIYKRDGDVWTGPITLQAPKDLELNDSFGKSVAINGEYAIVGAYNFDLSGNNTGAAFIYKRDGDVWTRPKTLPAPEGLEDDEFGVSVAIDGGYAIVGAHNFDLSGNDTGAAFIYQPERTNTWSKPITLQAPEGLENDDFGRSVAIDGEYAIVGANYFDLSGGVNTGGAFIYKRDGDVWTGPITLPAPEDLELNDGFGRYVAIDGEYAIVGATNFDLSGGVNTGGAFIYKRDGDVWTGPITLQAPKDLELNDHFGLSVAIDGEYAIVGGYRIDLSGGVNTGAAFIYKRDGDVWTGPITLQAPKDLEENDEFGISVAINGEYAIVGADQFDLSGGVNTGAAFIYKRDGDVWTGPITLPAPEGLENDEFGYSVAIDGEYAIVGANLFDLSGGVNTGGAFIYKRDGDVWTGPITLQAPKDLELNDSFGKSVAINGEYAIVGAYNFDLSGGDSGAVFIYKRDGDVWTGPKTLPAPEGLEDDEFGYSVAIDGEYAIVGAYNFDLSGGVNTGGAFIYKLE